MNGRLRVLHSLTYLDMHASHIRAALQTRLQASSEPLLRVMLPLS